MMSHDCVAARATDQYLHLSGEATPLNDLLERLFDSLRVGTCSPVKVSPEPGRSPAIKPVGGVGIRSNAGPVKVELKGDVAWLVGGQRELIRLLDQMKGMLERGPKHWEILRVFDEGYEHIDVSTRIDLVVTEPSPS